MDVEFSRLVDRAAQISSSGRWAGLNAVIVACADGMVLQDRLWHYQIFSSLWHDSCSEYLTLQKAHAEPAHNDVSLLAWRARNLLELRVLSAYCCLCIENARRIYEDAGRDGIDMLKTFAAWGRTQDTTFDWASKTATSDAELRSTAADIGIPDLDGQYKPVRDAARECGIGDEFALQFKLYSKFAHPTAFQLATPIHDKQNTMLRDAFLSGGCGQFVHTFTNLESALPDILPFWAGKAAS